MSSSKIAISIDSVLLTRVDNLVRKKIFPNRSKAFQEALKEKIERLEKSRLAIECARLDPVFEQNMAEEGLKEDLESWPEY